MKGRIEIITGCMFAGKSTELLRRVRKSNKTVLLIKPRMDFRYAKSSINTHSGEQIDAIVVNTVAEILNKLDDINLVAIDEAQFFDKSILEDCLKISDMGINIIIAGLEFDYLHEKFDSMKNLLNVADSITKLQAICAECSDSASYSHRIVNQKSKILVGHKDCYEPLCAQCYIKKNVK